MTSLAPPPGASDACSRPHVGQVNPLQYLQIPDREARVSCHPLFVCLYHSGDVPTFRHALSASGCNVVDSLVHDILSRPSSRPPANTTDKPRSDPPNTAYFCKTRETHCDAKIATRTSTSLNVFASDRQLDEDLITCRTDRSHRTCS